MGGWLIIARVWLGTHWRLCPVQTELGSLAKYDGPGHKGHAQLAEPANYEAIETGLTFLGLAGLMDPPRPEVRTSGAAL